MPSERILILNVDDYEAGRYATTRVLKQAGFDVKEAATGVEALHKVGTENPDLVILDINLPDIDGFEICRRLKEDPKTRNIPVLQLSAAYTGTENRIKGLELGADGYLTQPVEPRELIANVRSLLRMKAAIDEQHRADTVENALAASSNALSASLDYAKSLQEVTDAITDQFAHSAYIKVGDVILASSGKQSDSAPQLFPLTARGETLGELGMVDGRADARFRWFGEELARRVSLAIDNFNLFQEAVAGNEAKSNFLAVMSHELRTPLNAIIGYSDLLKAGIGGQLLDTQAQHVSRIDASARHLLTLIDEILTFSRLEAGKEDLDLENTNVGEVVHGAVELLGPLADAKSISLDVSSPDNINIVSDPQKLRQILLNLISNAIKFTHEGGVTVELRDEGDVVIRVRDTGLGIDPSKQEDIFEPFSQVKEKGKLTSGTGLGLSVSRSLAEMLGGSLSVESQVGQGSTFTVVLPKTTPKG